MESIESGKIYDNIDILEYQKEDYLFSLNNNGLLPHSKNKI